jgi:predicted RNase H-like nuclease (RuvC/YqgF family)
MHELNAYRDTMNKLSEDSTHQRDSLQAANAQVANLKAQLQRAVDQKVDKKLSARLRVCDKP